MTPEDFDFLAKVLKDKSGLALTSDKKYLLETRLQPLARQRNLANLHEYVEFLRKNSHDKAAYTTLIEAMTTNESMFFRDMRPFDQLKNFILPALKEKNKSTKRIKIWNAACSNGQEPYSVAMTLLEEKAKMLGFSYDIVGTDLDTEVIDKAKKGVYTQFEVQRGMPIQLLLKYFSQIDKNCWEVKDELKRMINYKKLNLLESFLSMGKFDVIFCRNVLIYFDKETKKDVLDRLAKCLNPGGYVILGATETVSGITDSLKPVKGQMSIFEAA